MSENTGGRIDKIVADPIDPNTVMFLINAIYFKGDWTHQFDPARTREAAFHRRDGTESTIDLMDSGEGFPIRLASDAAVQVGDLSYGGGAWRMTIVLPHRHDALQTVLDDLDANTWNAWMGSLDSTEIEVHLPKFTLEYEASLKDALTALGMNLAIQVEQTPQARPQRLPILRL